MHVETIYIPYKKMDDTFKLLPISDIHFGHKSCDKAKLVRDLKEKVDKRTIIVGVGDWADSILIKDAKRYRKEDDDNPTGEIADEQVEGLRQIFAPYADKVYAIGDGNHMEVFLWPLRELLEKIIKPKRTDRAIHSIINVAENKLFK